MNTKSAIALFLAAVIIILPFGAAYGESSEQERGTKVVFEETQGIYANEHYADIKYDSKTTAGQRVELRATQLKDMLKQAVESRNTSSINKQVDSIVAAMSGATAEDAVNEVITQFRKASDYLRGYIRNKDVRDSVKKSLISNTLELLVAASDLAEKMETQQNTIKFVQCISDYIGYLYDMGEMICEYDMQSDVASVLQKIITNIQPAFDLITDETAGYDALQRILNSTKRVVEKSKIEDVSQTFKNKIQDAVQKIVDGYGTVTIRANNNARIILKPEQKNEITRKATAMDRKIRGIADAMLKITGEATVQEKLVIYIDSSANASELAVEYQNGNLFKLIDDTGLDSWEITSRNGDLFIRKGAVQIPSDTRTTVISISRVVDNRQVDDRYKLYFKNDKIYDINMSYMQKDGTVSKIDAFNKEIMIKLPFTLKSGQHADKVAVLYLSPDGIPENMLAVYDSELKKATFWTQHLSQYAVRYNDVYFIDVTYDLWAKKYIDALAARGIVNGIGGGLFNPYANVSRAEFVSYIVRSFKAFDSKYKCSFEDVESNAWYYKTIASAVANNIAKGVPGNRFEPNAPITRQDMAVMISRAITKFMRLEAPSEENDAREMYDYETINDYARENANSVVAYGVMNGKPGGYFAPYDLVTKAEAVTAIYRMLELKKE